jgi:hypothetical protein
MRTDAPTVHTCEWGGDTSLPAAVVECVAAVTGEDPTDMQQLYHTIDPDALQSLVGSADRVGGSIAVDFTYNGCAVSVAAGEPVRVTPIQ